MLRNDQCPAQCHQREENILEAGEPAWRDFAEENDAAHPTSASVVGRCLFDMVLGEEVAAAARTSRSATAAA
jgi:hypothetical protein